jgi:hypothetical protein
MNHDFLHPQPATADGAMLRGWSKQDTRSVVIGVIGGLLIHLFVFLVGPIFLKYEAIDPSQAATRSAAKQYNIELAPEMFTKQEPKPQPMKFVETNPDAPENTPDKTNNFGAQSQQVAQEKPTPDGKSDRPATEGKKDFESNQIVSGQLTQPIEHIPAIQPPPVETPPAETVVTAPKAEQNPLTGFEKKEGDDPTAFGSNIAKIPDNIRDVRERVEGAKEAPIVEGATAMQPAIDPQRPRPRPTITRQAQVRPAILMQNDFGTSNIGPVAFDAKWSEYGRYLQQLIEAVQFQWERLLISGKIYPPGGTTVTVKFILNSEGNIARIVSVDNKSTDRAERACVSAITDRAPYGVWPDDMKAVLGTEQELTFTFYYQ